MNGHDRLTEAELIVVSLLADGLTAKEIAHAREVKIITVRTQIRSAFEKTGVNRQLALIRLYEQGALT